MTALFVKQGNYDEQSEDMYKKHVFIGQPYHPKA